MCNGVPCFAYRSSKGIFAVRGTEKEQILSAASICNDVRIAPQGYAFLSDRYQQFKVLSASLVSSLTPISVCGVFADLSGSSVSAILKTTSQTIFCKGEAYVYPKAGAQSIAVQQEEGAVKIHYSDKTTDVVDGAKFLSPVCADALGEQSAVALAHEGGRRAVIVHNKQKTELEINGYISCLRLCALP